MNSPDSKTLVNKKTGHEGDGSHPAAARSHAHTGMQNHAVNGGTKAGMKSQRHSRPYASYPSRPSTKGSVRLFVTAVVISVLIGGAYAFYTSSVPKQPWNPQIESKLLSQPATALGPASGEVVPVSESRPVITPNAVVNVPSVRLRTAPDISSGSVPGNLKRGEGVEILEKHVTFGPAWLKVRSTTGTEGWVFASVVRDKKLRD